MLKSLLFAAAIAPATVGSTGAWAAGPRDELLVTSAWLAQHAADKDLVILHVGTPDGYKAKHIPGAHLVGPNGLTVKTPEGLVTELPPPDDLRTELQSLGISDRSRVIVYSENDGIARATRIMLIFDAAGLGSNASLLDVVLKGWDADGHAVIRAFNSSADFTLPSGPLKLEKGRMSAPGTWTGTAPRKPGFSP